jgi:MYXO-CTERM domain-containing protein
MRRLLALAASTCALVWTSTALPCGGAFGAGFTIAPSQTIIVAQHDGTESYVFQPHFCGKAAEFGLVLPVPAALSAKPALVSPSLYTELGDVSAPRHISATQCMGQGDFAGGGADAGLRAPPNGTTVVDRGQVGIFEWSLLKADTPASFTSWLDANNYPHPAHADVQFAHYVSRGWYFVAFKVTASPTAPKATETICGDFGPLQLDFPTSTPVVPTRIAAAGELDPSQGSLRWRVYGLSPDQLGTSSSDYSDRTAFSGALSPAILSSHPALAPLARATDRLVALDLVFDPTTVADDLSLRVVPASDFRDTVTDLSYIDCTKTNPVGLGGGGGCALSPTTPATGAGLFGLVALALVARRRRRAFPHA